MAQLMTLGYILAALFLLGVLIMMHELGHYLVARWLGIEVKEFAIGMGPKVWSRKGKRDTLFSLRALPLGGFCLYYGEDEEVDDPRAYNRQPVWMRFLTVLAGPVMNFLLALVVAVVFFMAWGLEAPAPVIGELRPASPAVEAGLMPGDRLLAIGGVPITQPAEASALVRNSGGKPLEIAVGRGEETLTISVAPHYNEERQSYLVGIEGWAAVGPVPVIGELDPALPAAEAGLMPGDAILAIDGVPIAQAGEIAALVGASEGAPLRMTVGRGTEMLTVLVEPRYSEERQTYQVGILRYAAGRMPLPFGQAISSSVVLCRHVVVVTYQALTGLIFRGEGREEISGPVGIVNVIQQETRSGGLPIYLQLGVLISINLGLMNLLPIPGLDGSRLIFNIVEAIRRKPLNRNVEGMIHFLGVVALLGIMLLFTYNDILNIFRAR